MAEVTEKNLFITLRIEEEAAQEYKKAMFSVLKHTDTSQINNEILYWYLQLLEQLS